MSFTHSINLYPDAMPDAHTQLSTILNAASARMLRVSYGVM